MGTRSGWSVAEGESSGGISRYHRDSLFREVARPISDQETETDADCECERGTVVALLYGSDDLGCQRRRRHGRIHVVVCKADEIVETVGGGCVLVPVVSDGLRASDMLGEEGRDNIAVAF